MKIPVNNHRDIYRKRQMEARANKKVESAPKNRDGLYLRCRAAAVDDAAACD